MSCRTQTKAGNPILKQPQKLGNLQTFRINIIKSILRKTESLEWTSIIPNYKRISTKSQKSRIQVQRVKERTGTRRYQETLHKRNNKLIFIIKPTNLRLRTWLLKLHANKYKIWNKRPLSIHSKLATSLVADWKTPSKMETTSTKLTTTTCTMKTRSSMKNQFNRN